MVSVLDICWLVKFRGHVGKVEKEPQRIKKKNLSTLQVVQVLKNGV